MPPADPDARGTVWLVLRAQAGDRAALEALLAHADGLLRPYATLMLREADAADDVLQDALLLVYRKLGTLREPRAFAGARALDRVRWKLFHRAVRPPLKVTADGELRPAGPLSRAVLRAPTLLRRRRAGG